MGLAQANIGGEKGPFCPSFAIKVGPKPGVDVNLRPSWSNRSQPLGTCGIRITSQR